MPVAQEQVSTAGPSTQQSGAQLPPPSSASEAEAEGDGEGEGEGEGESESESHSPDPTRVLQLVDRKRILRACDLCRQRRVKCDEVVQQDETITCKLCREFGHHCAFTAPVRKRGPRPGPRKRRRTVTSAGADERAPTASSPQVGDTDVEYRSPSRHPRTYALSKGRHVERDGSAIESQVGSSTRGGSPGRTAHARRLLLGLPLGMVDELLAVYFTHVHNTWPLVFKPLFNVHSTPAPLLLSMLAVAACVAPEVLSPGFDGDVLFRMAEKSLHYSRTESRIDNVQAMILLSLRQTGNGDKSSAFMYAGRACTMALNLGLNLASDPDIVTPTSHGANEIKSRVFWNCYVLDKTLAEETGRSFLLPYRRCTVPFPSAFETDELEVWPPLPNTTASPPRSVRHIVPRRGYVISCFTWTCRLAMIVEDILNLQPVRPPSGDTEWDEQFAVWARGRESDEEKALGLARQLQHWKKHLPRTLQVDESDTGAPLPHVILGLAWWTTATILLHSRFISRRHDLGTLTPAQADLVSTAHSVCSEAAQQTVDLLRHLDKKGLLAQMSADVIHILSLATLFEAFDSTNRDVQLAAVSKANFTQCCEWLREFSSSWPAASAHKMFFEAVYQGGLSLSSTPNVRPPSPAVSPSISQSIQDIRRRLSFTQNPTDMSSTLNSGGSVTDPLSVSSSSVDSRAASFLQLPQFYWNHLQAPPAPTAPPADNSWEAVFNLGVVSPVTSTAVQPWTEDGNLDWLTDPTAEWSAVGQATTNPAHGNIFANTTTSMTVTRPDGIPSDQAEMNLALMRYLDKANRALL